MTGRDHPDDRKAELSPAKRRLLEKRLAARRAGAGQATPIRRQTSGPFPSSFNQERFWLLEQLEPGNPAHNIPYVSRLTGQLDRQAFEAAIAGLIERHEIFRTTFQVLDGVPMQVVAPELSLPIPFHDLAELSESMRARRRQEIIHEAKFGAFDLERGPLSRVVLLRHHDRLHEMVVCQHHIVNDGLGIQYLGEDFAALYSAAVRGGHHGLSPLPVQYKDWATWQRQQLQGETLERGLAYWRKQLAALPVLDIPKDHPKRHKGGSVGARERLELPPALMPQLRELSREQRVTPFMTLLACFNVLLMRVTGETDIALGTPVAGRTRHELNRLPGFFINSLVLRNDLSGGLTFTELLQRVRRTSLEAQDHQDVPFELVLQELQPERHLDRSPLFQVMFDYVDFVQDRRELPGLLIESEGTLLGTFYDLTLYAWVTEQGVTLELEYDDALFEARTIRRWLSRLQRLMEAAVQDPDCAVDRLPLLGEEEERELQAWGQGPDCEPQDIVHRQFALQAQRQPQALALSFPSRGQSLSYGELDVASNRLAHRLRSLGVGPEVLVGVCLPRGIDLLVSLLAIWKAGGAYVPIDPNLPAERVRFLIEDTQLAVLLTHAGLDSMPSPSVPSQGDAEVPFVLRLDASAESIAQEPPGPVADLSRPEHLSYVIYTSGSTGQPKGTLIEHSALANHVGWVKDTFQINESDRLLLRTPLSFDASVWELVHPLVAGAQLIIAAPGAEQDADELLELAATQGITVLQTVPSLLQVWVDEPRLADCQSLRHLICAGEALSSALVDRVHERLRQDNLQLTLHNLYGPSEACIDSSSQICGPETARGRDVLPIGRPASGVRLSVLDEHQAPSPVGAVGEIYVGGPGVARGYLGRPELTASVFLPDPAAPGQTMYRTVYRTGDLGRWLDHGVLEYVGRRDQQVKISGYRIELGEIEATLLQHPGVRQAVVLAQPVNWHQGDPESTSALSRRRLVAYVVPQVAAWVADASDSVRITELRSFLQTSLPPYMLPLAWVFLDALPLNAAEKVDRKALASSPLRTPSPTQAGAAAPPPTPPGSATEKQLVPLWADCLGLEEVGIHDDFFGLGGSSLMAMQLASRMGAALQRRVPLRMLFELPSVARLAQALDHADSVPLPSLQASVLSAGSSAGSSEGAPLSHAQQRLWFLDQLDPASPVYNLAAALRLRGHVDRDALQQACDALVRDHDILRTTFELRDGTAHQVIHPANGAHALKLHAEQVTDRPAHGASTGASTRARAEELAREPFDLAQGPLARAYLLSPSSDEHILLFVQHHIVSDGWSLGIAMRQFMEHYEAACAGVALGRHRPQLRYADFARWQQAAQQDAAAGLAHAAGLEFWKHSLTGAPFALELPTDRPRPATQSRAGRRLRFPLPQGLSDDLRELSRSLNATLFDTLAAACSVLLERLSGAEDMVLGTVVANRTRLEQEDVLGLFVNTLPLRVQLTGDPTFAQLVARVHGLAINAWEHQEIPFEQVVEAINPPRDLSRAPIFQVAFGVDNLPDPPMALAGLELEVLDLDLGSAKLDLNIMLEERATRLEGAVEFSTDLFDDDTIRRWWSCFETLLRSCVATPRLSIHRLAILDELDRRQLQDEFAGPNVSLAEPSSLPARFLAAARAHRESTALIDLAPSSPRPWTYRQLHERVLQLATELQARGVGPESLVGLVIPRSTEALIAMLATWVAGGAVLPLDVDQPATRLARLMEEAGVSLTLVCGSSAAELRHGPWERLDLEGLAALGSPEGSDVRAPEEHFAPPAPSQLAYVLFTSGSTGQPKGVEVTHGALAEQFAWYLNELAATSADRFMARIPIHFDANFLEWVPPLLTGGSLVMVPPEQSADPRRLAEIAATHDVSVLHEPPPMLEALLREPQLAHASALRHLTTGGDLLHEQLIASSFAQLPIERAITLYGPTEACIDVTCRRWDRGDMDDSSLGIATVGTPHDNVRLHLVDRRDRLVPVGVPGEILISGRHLARGYRGQPEATVRAFPQDPFGPRGQRVYRTGDLGRWHADGQLEFLGRLDAQVKVSGQRVEPGELEATLLGHPAIRDAHVRARHDRAALLAWVAVQPGERPALDEAGLKSWLRQRLPPILIPSRVSLQASLPRLSTGKIDGAALPPLDRSGEQTAQAKPDHGDEPPLTPTEALVLQVFREVLERSTLGLHDDFFESGGNSLMALKLVADMEHGFEQVLSLRELFEQPTPARVAQLLEHKQHGLPGAGPRTGAALDLRAEATLDASLSVSAPPASWPPRKVFLTGATGFLGIHVLAELLLRSDVEVHALVRADSPQLGLERLTASLERYALYGPIHESGALTRVHAVPGQLDAQRFGLGERQFDDLGRELDAIIHSGASVDFFKHYGALKAANVDGTREVLRLACQTRTKPVHYVSTIGVIAFERLQTKLVRESDPLPGPEGLEGGYEQSKWVAEQLVHEASARGLPVSVHRPGRVSASATTGLGNTEDMASRVFAGCVAMGAVPDIDGSLDITPVDYCAAALVHLFLHQRAEGRVYHLVNPQRARMQDAYDAAERVGHATRRLSYAAWHAEFLERVGGKPDDPMYPLLPLLTSASDGLLRESDFLPDLVMPELGWDNVRKGLEGSGIACPVVDTGLIERWIDAASPPDT